MIAEDFAQNLWAAVRKTAGCWLWHGATTWDGYGRVSAHHKEMLAHRVSWALANGPIPRGRLVLHRCDVRNCVRPEHLFLGSHTENMADMEAKGRRTRGTRIPQAKFNEDIVRSLRRRLADGERMADLAREFGVTIQAVFAVKKRITWAHVPDATEATE